MGKLNINRTRLTTQETVRYNGPLHDGDHGTYTAIFMTPAGNQVQVHMSLEAMIQLKQRVDAALQHMITH